mmetsp:Transcript_2810/g.4111  ORF Transcript_2810/g.4111 Transcript_2810/m.4111 type:complete len:102 (-) Transcript_2810:1158-1463(-)
MMNLMYQYQREFVNGITILNFLRRPEVLNANHNSGIHIVKVGAASTESYQALDVSICFKELAKALADCTLKYDSSKLKASITRLLQQSNEISSHPVQILFR